MKKSRLILWVISGSMAASLFLFFILLISTHDSAITIAARTSCVVVFMVCNAWLIAQWINYHDDDDPPNSGAATAKLKLFRG